MTIDKKDLIEKVNSIKSEIDVSKVIKDDDNSNDRNYGVGTNQFRDLASTSKACDTYDELRLLVQYKTAKSEMKKNKDTQKMVPTAWKIKGYSGKMFGQIIIGKMDDIAKEYEKEGTESLLTALSLFFGYLYQSARVWKMEQPKPTNNNNRHNNDKMGGNR